MTSMTNEVWKKKLQECLLGEIVSPRGAETREIICANYKVPMPAYISLVDRHIKLDFMFGEAAWIISGSNRLSDLTRFMKSYKNFSDDEVFLKGAYGPKFIDQLPYVLDTLVKDQFSRQAVFTIWRERPGSSKDVPCTVAGQFFIRDGYLSMIVTMRSNDVVLGFTYDVFTFSMMANSLRLLLKQKGVDVTLGYLYVNPGSLHIYERHYKDAKSWIENSTECDLSIQDQVDWVMEAETYEDLILRLDSAATSSLNDRSRG